MVYARWTARKFWNISPGYSQFSPCELGGLAIIAYYVFPDLVVDRERYVQPILFGSVAGRNLVE
jgi:hypothetical protein